MSAVPVSSISQSKSIPMEVIVKGKIDARRRYESSTYTRMITPAADAYSRPATVEIRSKGKLGEVGEEVSVVCKLGGYSRKPYRVTDKDTGETSMVIPVDMTLDAIE